MVTETKNIESLLFELGHERRIHYALDRLSAALEEAGGPEKNVKSVVIAGTNGKGSVTQFVSSALAIEGYKTATYSSPHLESITERFQLNGKPIEKRVLDDLADQYFDLATRHKLSYFEFLTLLFFIWAKKVHADIEVLEVGLGGRLDATNVTTPLVCAVTSIDYDHMSYLGNTLDEILHEKISVVPKGGKLISGIVQPSLVALAKEWCLKHDAKFFSNEEAIQPTGKTDWDFQEVTLNGETFRLKNPNPRWVKNANTAYQLLRVGFPEMKDSTIREAFSKTHFPGRFETVSKNPHIILSGDHNPAGTQSLLETLDRLPPKDIHVLCAFSLDKPYREMFEVLRKRAKSITLTTFPTQGNLPNDYREMASRFQEDAFHAFHDLEKNLMPNEVLLVTGSLYLVGLIRAHLR